MCIYCAVFLDIQLERAERSIKKRAVWTMNNFKVAVKAGVDKALNNL